MVENLSVQQRNSSDRDLGAKERMVTGSLTWRSLKTSCTGMTLGCLADSRFKDKNRLGLSFLHILNW
jgi:hypothetical protein